MQEKNIPNEKKQGQGGQQWPDSGKQGGQGDVGKKGGDTGDVGKGGDMGNKGGVEGGQKQP